VGGTSEAAVLRRSSARLDRAAGDATAERRRDLDRLRMALSAHDPQRTLERGYALVEGADGAPLTSAAAAREAGAVRVRFADDVVDADVRRETPKAFDSLFRSTQET
jgi:exodeoxyribonuclease VII large subunit